MTLRLRYHLLILSLFMSLALANVALLHSLGRAEVAWGLAEQSKGYALCLAVFVGQKTPVSPATLAHLQPALLRLSRAGNLGLQYFESPEDGWIARPLPGRPDSPLPPPPTAEVLTALEHEPAVSILVATPDSDHDLVYGYASIGADPARPRTIVGVAARDTVMRTQLHALARKGALLCALALLISIVAAETLTRFTRRGITRLETDAAALTRGEYAGNWEPIRVAELNDLGTTLHAIADILQEGIRQTRRRFVQAELLPRQEDTAADCQDLCDAAPPPIGPGPRVLVRRINHGSPEDFWGLRIGPDGWCLAAGRLAPPAAETDPLERVVRANTARDFVLGAGLAQPNAEPWAQLSAAFPCERGEHLRADASGRLQHGILSAEPPPPGPADPPPPRGVVGTLTPESLRLARDFLRQFPDQPLGAAADKLASILAVHDRGLLVVYETTSPP